MSQHLKHVLPKLLDEQSTWPLRPFHRRTGLSYCHGQQTKPGRQGSPVKCFSLFLLLSTSPLRCTVAVIHSRYSTIFPSSAIVPETALHLHRPCSNLALFDYNFNLICMMSHLLMKRPCECEGQTRRAYHIP